MNNDAAYIKIMENLERNSHRAPRDEDGYSKTFIKYLKLLYTQDEADLVQHLKIPREIFPMGFDKEDYTTAAQVVEASGRDKDEVRQILNDLARRRCILGIGAAFEEPPLEAVRNISKLVKVLRRGSSGAGLGNIASDFYSSIREDMKVYGLRGVKEFSLYAIPHIPMLLNHHVFFPEIGPNDKEAIRLYEEFFVKEEFYKRYESGDEGTAVGRVIPIKKSIEHGEKILAMEEANMVIDAAEDFLLVPCPCRTRTEKLGERKCKDNNPVGYCIFMGISAIGMGSMGYGTKATKEEVREYMNDMIKRGLVPHAENHQHEVNNFICLCCKCCCSQTRGRTVWNNPNALAPSNFIPVANDDCIKCGKCVKRCMFNALHIDEETGKPVVDAEKCVGCGICTITCKQEALKLHRMERSKQFATPQELYRVMEAENKIPRKN